MLITERISNPSPRGIHLRQSGMRFKTGWFFNIFYLSLCVLKSMFSSINRFETSHRARVGNFCFTYEIWVQSKLVSYAFRAFATFLIFVGILVILTHSDDDEKEKQKRNSSRTRNYNFLKLATQNVAGNMLVSKSVFRAPRNGVATVHHAVSWKHKTSPQQDWDFETGFSSAAD